MTDANAVATTEPQQPRAPLAWLPGVGLAAAGAALALGVHVLLPAIPLLTAAVVIGIICGQLPALRAPLAGPLAPGIALAGRRMMRIGVVLLGLKLSIVDIAGLGWPTLIGVVVVVLLTFGLTVAFGKVLRLPGQQPVLIAAGFAICGASAIGAMSGALRSKNEESATPVALVTLCGTLAIAVLPLLWSPLGLSDEEFGHWVGGGVHDVGQVVATAQIAGTSALAVAVVVKLTRVLMLAPMVTVTSLLVRRRSAGGEHAGPRPPVIPLFVAGFIAAVLLRTWTDIPVEVLEAADIVQTAVLAMALFSLGSAVRLRVLFGTGWRALLVGLLSWGIIAALSLGAVLITRL